MLFAYLLGLCLCYSLLVLLLALFVLVALWVFVSFSLSVYAQKERARRVGASFLVPLWVALFGCSFVLLELFRCQPVSIVAKFDIKKLPTGAANFFALACVLTCVVIFPFHIFCFLSVLTFFLPVGHSTVSGMMKLLHAVSILSAFPAIHATVKKLQL